SLSPGILNEWKGEELRLLALNPPRFMPCKYGSDLEEWRSKYKARLSSGAITPGWFDPMESFVIPNDRAKQGFLMQYIPYPINSEEMELHRLHVEQYCQEGNTADAVEGNEGRPNRSGANFAIDEGPSSSAAGSAPSAAAAANATAMGYSPRGHFSGETQSVQRPPQPPM
ncbi:hypothetical protein PMAYCL1PPCAC_28787, partial [Pristionchus mayeri]